MSGFACVEPKGRTCGAKNKAPAPFDTEACLSKTLAMICIGARQCRQKETPDREIRRSRIKLWR